MSAEAVKQRAPWHELLSRLAVIGIFVAMLGILAPATPAFAECKPTGIPDYAGSGQPGMIDQKTDEASGGNYYGQYGWSGLRWNNCDIREFGAVADDMRAQMDTWTGNAFMGLATLEGSVMTSMHKWTADPTATLKPIDDRIVDLSNITRAVLFDDWVFPVIAFAAIGIMAGAITRQVRPALMTLGATALALGFVSVVATAPLQIAQSVDGVVSGIVSAADAQALKYAGIPGPDTKAEDGKHIITAKPEEATGAILNDAMLAPIWRQGQTGTGDWTAATDRMFKASTATWDEVSQGFKPEDKKNDYNTAVDAIKNDQETARQYQVIKGQQYNRAGMGFMAMLMMTIVSIIRIPAEALVFLGMLVIRFIPILGPVFALLAIPTATRMAATAAVKTVAASVYNTAIFGVIASVHTAITAILYVNTTNLFLSTIISAIVTYLLWKLSKPFQSVTKLATGRQVSKELQDAPDGPRKLLDKGLGYLTGTAVVNEGGNDTGAGRNGRKGEGKIKDPQAPHPGPDHTRTGLFGRTETTIIGPRAGQPYAPGQNNYTPDGPVRNAPELHPEWTEAPKINQQWANGPSASGEDHSAGLFEPDRTTYEDTMFTPPEAPKQRPDRPEVSVLSEPEFIGGTMVTNIFVPETPGEHTTTAQQPNEAVQAEGSR